jgi:GNAT superfamily N-acetyltransferase
MSAKCQKRTAPKLKIERETIANDHAVPYDGFAAYYKFQMTYDISLATLDDIPNILALQEANLPESGGTLSVRLTPDWFQNAILENSVIAGRRESKVVGYVVGSSLAANAHVTIIQAMLRSFPPAPGCYVYGPICVAESERGKGLAAAMFAELRARLSGRPALLFIRADNAPSLQAHRKMGMQELGTFTNGDVLYVTLTY